MDFRRGWRAVFGVREGRVSVFSSECSSLSREFLGEEDAIMKWVGELQGSRSEEGERRKR